MFRHRPKHDLYIGKPEIRIQYNDPLIHFPELYRKVDRRIRFSHAAFSAGHCDHSGCLTSGLVLGFDNIS